MEREQMRAFRPDRWRKRENGPQSADFLSMVSRDEFIPIGRKLIREALSYASNSVNH